MYQIIIKKKAKKFIDKLPKNERIRVVSAIMRLPDGEDIKDMMTYFGSGWEVTVSFILLTTENVLYLS